MIQATSRYRHKHLHTVCCVCGVLRGVFGVLCLVWSVLCVVCCVVGVKSHQIVVVVDIGSFVLQIPTLKIAQVSLLNKFICFLISNNTS